MESKKFKRIVFFALVVLSCMVLGALIRQAHFAAEGIGFSDPPTPSRVSAFGWNATSPHFRDESGKPYIMTHGIMFGSGTTAAGIKALYPTYNEALGLEDPANAAIKTALSNEATNRLDFAIGSHLIINKTKNPTAELYSTDKMWYFHKAQVKFGQADSEQTGFYKYLLDKYPSDPTAFETNFLHASTTRALPTVCAGKTGLPAQQLTGEKVIDSETCSDYVLNFNNSTLRNNIADYLATLLPSLKTSGYNGMYFDSGNKLPPDDTIEYGSVYDDAGNIEIDDTANQFITDYSALLDTLRPVFDAQSMKLYVNGAGWKEMNFSYLFADKLNAFLIEQFDTHQWTSADYPEKNITRIGAVETNHPNTRMFVQNGMYADADIFSSWKACGTKELAERMQTGALAAFLIEKGGASVSGTVKDIPYRYAGEGCESNGMTEWKYDETGSLPKSIAYNIGQPASSVTKTSVTAKSLNNSTGATTNSPTSVFSRIYDHATVYYRPMTTGLENYPTNLKANAKANFNESSLVKLDNSSDFPLNIGANKCMLKNDGSIVGPISQVSLYERDGVILVDCGIKTNIFTNSTFDTTKSNTEWWADTATATKTLISYDALSKEEMFTESLTNRPATVKLTQEVGDGQTASITYDNKLSLNPASTYDLDTYTYLAPNKVAIDSTTIPAFNAPAQITLTGVTFDNPIILKDGEECGSNCQLTTNSGGVFSFHVNGFSAYEVMERVTVQPTPDAGGTTDTTQTTSSGTTYTDPYPTKKVSYTKKTASTSRSSVTSTATATTSVTPGATTTVIETNSADKTNITLGDTTQATQSDKAWQKAYVLGGMLAGLLATAVYFGFALF